MENESKEVRGGDHGISANPKADNNPEKYDQSEADGDNSNGQSEGMGEDENTDEKGNDTGENEV